MIECLESRQLLSLVAPTMVSAELQYRYAPYFANNRTKIALIDNNTEEEKYRVEYSADGATGWQAISPDIDGAAGTGSALTAYHELSSAQKLYYRSRAVSGAQVSDPSQVVTFITDSDRALRVTATVAPSATGYAVTLQWPQESESSSSDWEYYVYRRLSTATDWDWTPLNAVALPGSATQFTDQIASGEVWEYMVQRASVIPYGESRWGYAFVSGDAAAVQQRGTVLLVLDQTIEGALADRVERLKSDLVGDGWKAKSGRRRRIFNCQLSIDNCKLEARAAAD